MVLYYLYIWILILMHWYLCMKGSFIGFVLFMYMIFGFDSLIFMYGVIKYLIGFLLLAYIVFGFESLKVLLNLYCFYIWFFILNSLIFM